MQAKITEHTNTTQITEGKESFQEAGIGMVTEGWEVVGLGDILIPIRMKIRRDQYKCDLDIVKKIPFDSGRIILRGKRKTKTDLYISNIGTLVVSKINLHQGAVAVNDIGKIACTTHYEVYNLKKSVDMLYFWYFIRSPGFKRLLYEDIKFRGFKKEANFNYLKDFKICLPRLSEQRKIAKVLSTIHRAIEQQDKIIETAKNLKKSLMQKLFTKGVNTENTKESEIGEVPTHWHVAKCQDVCEKITVGIVVKPASLYVQTGVPCFRSLNILEDRLNENDLVFISPDANEMHSKSKLREGDVLVVRTGYPGTSCVVPRKYDGANCIDLVILRPDKNIMSKFLSRFFHSPAGRRQTLRNKGGLAQQHLNVGAVKKTLVPIPPLSEQEEIIRILSRVDSKINVEESRKKTLKELFKTMLHKLMTAEIRLKDIEV